MRDGRRKRLGLAEGTENPNDGLSYLDNILSDADVAGQSNILNLDTDANVRTTDQDYVSDAYNFYLGGGFPQEEVEAPVVAPDFIGGELIDTSGQDQATSGLGLGDTTITGGTNLNDYAGMGDMTGGVTNDNITVENIAQNQTPYDVPMDPSNPGASIENIIAQQNQTIPDDPSIDAFDINEVGDPALNPGSINVGDQPMAAGPFDYLQEPSISTIANPEIFDDYAGVNDPQVGDPGFENYTPSFEPEQQGIIEQAFSKVGSTAENIMNDLSQIPGAVVDFANQTVDILGKKINVGSTLLKAGINRIVGGPISLVFDALGALGLEGGPSLQTDKANSIGLLNENASGGYQDIYGINTQSALGDYDQYNIDRVEDLTDIVADQKSRGLTNTLQMRELEDRQEYNTISGVGGDIDDDPTGDAGIAEQIEADNRAAEAQAAAAREAEIDANREAARDAQNEQNAQNARDAAAASNAAATAAAQRELNRTSQYNRGNGGGGGGGGSGDSNSPGGGGSYCFDPSTPIQMADGSIKEIKNIQLGDDTKGGEVTGVFQFKASDDIHNYKGVTVAGGHYVKENNEFIMVKDSPLAVKMDKIPVVYSLDTSARRIFIKDIEFADYNGDGVAKNFLSNAGVTLEGFDKEVLRQVQQRLI